MQSSSAPEYTIEGLAVKIVEANDAYDRLGQEIIAIGEQKVEPALRDLQKEIKDAKITNTEALPASLQLIHIHTLNASVIKAYAFGHQAALRHHLQGVYLPIKIVCEYLTGSQRVQLSPADDMILQSAPEHEEKQSDFLKNISAPFEETTGARIADLSESVRQGMVEVTGKGHRLVESKEAAALEKILSELATQDPTLEAKYQEILNNPHALELGDIYIDNYLGEGLHPILRKRETFRPGHCARQLAGGIFNLDPEIAVSTSVTSETRQLEMFGLYNLNSSSLKSAVSMIRYKQIFIRYKACLDLPTSEFARLLSPNIEIRAKVNTLPFTASSHSGLDLMDQKTQAVLMNKASKSVSQSVRRRLASDEVVVIRAYTPERGDVILRDRDKTVPTTTFNSAREAPCGQMITTGDRCIDGRTKQLIVIFPWQKGFKSRHVAMAVGAYSRPLSERSVGKLEVFIIKVDSSDKDTLRRHMREEAKKVGSSSATLVEDKAYTFIKNLISGKQPYIDIEDFAAFADNWGICPFTFFNIEELEATDLHMFTMGLPFKVSAADINSIEQFRQFHEIDLHRAGLQTYKIQSRELAERLGRLKEYEPLEAKLDQAIAKVLNAYEKELPTELDKANSELDAIQHEFFSYLAILEKRNSLACKEVIACSTRDDLTGAQMVELFNKQFLGSCIEYIREYTLGQPKESTKSKVQALCSELNTFGFEFEDITAIPNLFQYIQDLLHISRAEFIYFWGKRALEKLRTNREVSTIIDTTFRAVRALGLFRAASTTTPSDSTSASVAPASDNRPVAADAAEFGMSQRRKYRLATGKRS